jgi:hypothetical protein
MSLPDSKLIKMLTTQKKKSGLSKALSLEWKKVCSSTYTYNNGQSTDVELTMRDTTIYNSNGTVKLHKVSNASSGWSEDSLESIDSVVTIDANTCEMYSYIYSSGMIYSGTKDEFRYSEDKKSIVDISYTLDLISSNWVPSTKDSITFSEPYDFVNYLQEMSLNNNESIISFIPLNTIGEFPYNTLVSDYTFEYDTISNQWNLDGSLEYKNALKTPTSLTCEIKQGIGTKDSVTQYLIYNFRSSNYTFTNVSSMVMCRLKPDQTGYDSLVKYFVDFKSGDYLKYNCFVWNDSTKKWDTDFYNLDCKLDSHNNDTSSIFINTLFSTPDTTFEKTKRTYDAYGNNIESIVSSGSNESNLKLSEKTVTTYVQIDVPVKRNHIVVPVKNAHVTISNNIITISASKITEIALYNGSGRLIHNKKQNCSDAVSLDINKIKQPVASGVYIARVKYDGKRADFKVNISK